MLRPYENSSKESVRFFVGNEIEKTPAQNMKTLFVVGREEPIEILSKLHQLENRKIDSEFNPTDSVKIFHVYLGANKSFTPFDDYEFSLWMKIARALLEEGLWVSLDLDPKWIEKLVDDGICYEYRRFIPQISVQIPHARQLGYNATIKIDDNDFDYSNPGVWCHQLNDLLNKESFTDWDEYKNDNIVG